VKDHYKAPKLSGNCNSLMEVDAQRSHWYHTVAASGFRILLWEKVKGDDA
jgi:hypothetical protein